MSVKKMSAIRIVWGMIFVSIVVLLTVFGFIYKGKIQKYEDLEVSLEQTVKQYVDQKFMYPEDGAFIKVSSQELIDEGLLDSFQVGEETCEGYVIVQKDNLSFSYKPFIKCARYKTKNFDKN